MSRVIKIGSFSFFLDQVVLFVCLFSSAYVFFKSPFEFYFHYLFLLTLIPFFAVKFGFPKSAFTIFIVPLLVGFVHVVLGNCNAFAFVKVFGGLLATFIFYNYVLFYYNFNLNKLFSIYIKFCLIICFVGVFQTISFVIGFKYGYDFSWILNKWGFVRGGIVGFRVNSILSEPAQLAIILSPACYVAVRNLLHKKNFLLTKYQSLLIVLITVLTTSSVGFIGLLFCILLNTNSFRLRYFFIGVVIFLSSFFLAYNYVGDFKSRFDSATGLWLNNDFSLKNTNNSSFVLYNNLHIAKENLFNHPFFGTGLGSHEDAFNKHTLTGKVIQYDFAFNKKDGNSLFVRLCTETGLVGLFFILFIVVKCFIWKIDNDKQAVFLIVSQSLFILILITLIRQGNYMLNGLPLIFLIYYYNFINYKKEVNKPALDV